jgi:hypothetical protein
MIGRGAGMGRGGGGGGGAGFGRAIRAERQPTLPPERRNRTARRIVAFFAPYRLQVGVVLVAILTTSFLGLINPILLKLLIDEVITGRNFTRLDLYIGLMIVIPIVSGLIGVGQSYLNNVIGQNVMQDLRNALYAHLQSLPLRFFTETRTGEIQSRLSNDVGGIQAVVTDTATSVTANVAVVLSTIAAMIYIDWRLTILSVGLLPFFMYLTLRVGRVRREVSAETQRTLADVTAVTEETLSVSGVLLSKTFGQQGRGHGPLPATELPARRAADPPGDGRALVLHDHRHDLQHHAGVRVLAGRHARDERRSACPDGRLDRRLHHAPEPALLPDRPAPQRPGRDLGLARLVRPHLRVPGPRPGDRGRAGRGDARPGRRPRPGPVPSRLVPLPDEDRPVGTGARRCGR